MSSSLILCNIKPFLNWADCDMLWKVDGIQQPVPTSSVVGRHSRTLPKVKPAPKKDHGHCLVVCWQSEPLQLSESWRNHYIWELCLANWWDALKTAMPAASIGQQKGPNSSPWHHPTTHHTTNASNELGHEVLPHLPYSPELSPTVYHFFRLFSGKSFHNQQDTEYAFQDVIESQITNFYAKGINKLISHQQKFFDCNSTYFD